MLTKLDSPIVTERLIMRPFELLDDEGLFELDSDPEVQKYLGGQTVDTIEEIRERMQGVFDQYEKNGIGRWVVLDKNSGELIGWSGLKWETGIRDFGYYDIGYRFKPRFWGKGIATETALAWMHIGFNDLGLDKICGGAHIDNIGSNKVLQKAGLNHTETFDFEGEMHNWYEVRRDEWLKKFI